MQHKNSLKALKIHCDLNVTVSAAAQFCLNTAKPFNWFVNTVVYSDL
jgi:hypothetical protein